ncbi:MAG: hypothetical protein B0D92_02330 [Spirochaeta sp. LUC14_002_19_P3]|nr:MAG: hypothetical protein B0D92_02330 [Spirochaeta sp. LUC14_002_19_P3]
MAEIHEQRADETKIDTVMAEDISFDGEVTYTKDLMIKGTFTGKIRSTGDLYIAEGASVEADITAHSVNIWGKVTGNITATARVELQGSAEVTGDITAPKIIMGTGCRFDGMSRMGSNTGGQS